MDQHDRGFDPTLGSLPDAVPATAPPRATPLAPSPERPAGTACRVCATDSAVLYGFAAITGMVFRYKSEEFRGVWCPSCAQAIGRRAQSRTLLTGWFGLISAVMNVGAVAKNSSELWRARSLSASPSTPTGNAATLPSGRPVFLRAGMAGAIVVLGLLSWTIATVATDATTEVDRLLVGDCLDDPGFGLVETVETVDCSKPHDLEVFAVAGITGFFQYPGNDQIGLFVDEACFNAFSDYIGADYAASPFGYSFIAPSAESWNLSADRRYSCLLGAFGEQTSGSARDSGN